MIICDTSLTTKISHELLYSVLKEVVKSWRNDVFHGILRRCSQILASVNMCSDRNCVFFQLYRTDLHNYIMDTSCQHSNKVVPLVRLFCINQ